MTACAFCQRPDAPDHPIRRLAWHTVAGLPQAVWLCPPCHASFSAVLRTTGIAPDDAALEGGAA